MNNKIGRVFRLAAALVSLCLLCGCSTAGLSPAMKAGGNAPDARGETGWMRSEMSGGAYAIPEFLKTEFHDEAAVGNDVLQADLSQLAQGVVLVRAENDIRMKFQIVCNDEKYNYDLPGDGSTVIYPLNMGDGTYTFRLMEQVEDTKYTCAWSESRDVVMDDEFQPFLRTNQFVPYEENCFCVEKARSIASECSTDGEVAAAIYDYLVENIRYDQTKADTVKNGYIPNPDETLTTGTGICFDYASLAAAMLRSVGVPCKLITGYVNQSTYHAWNSFYLQNEGWITAEIRITANHWQRVDITFAAGGMPADEMLSDTEYTVRFVY